MKKLFTLLLACSLMLTLLPAAVFAEGEANTSELWSADIPASFAEASFSSSSSSASAEYTKTLEGEEKPVVKIKLQIYGEKSMAFRKALINAGIDLHAYSEGQVETTTIAGYDFVASTTAGSGTAVYYGRDISAQLTLKLTITGDQEDADLKTFLDSLKYTLPDKGGAEAPYPWEGAHLVTTTGSETVGEYTVSAVQVIGDESLLPMSVFDNRIAVVGNLLYLMSQKQLFVYELDAENNTMTLAKQYDLDAEYTSMSADENGIVYLSKFMKNVLMYKDGEPLEAPSPAKDEMAVAKDGSFGISFFVKNTDLKKVNLETGEAVEFLLTGDNAPVNISELMIDGDYIFMNGSVEKDINLFVADYDGNVIADLKDEDGSGLGSITFGMKLPDGYMGMDGNMREIVLWDNDGNWLGAAKASKVFGTSYPWISGFSRIDDTSCYVSMSQERDDKSWDEVVVYKLTFTK